MPKEKVLVDESSIHRSRGHPCGQVVEKLWKQRRRGEGPGVGLPCLKTGQPHGLSFCGKRAWARVLQKKTARERAVFPWRAGDAQFLLVFALSASASACSSWAACNMPFT